MINHDRINGVDFVGLFLKKEVGAYSSFKLTVLLSIRRASRNK